MLTVDNHDAAATLVDPTVEEQSTTTLVATTTSTQAPTTTTTALPVMPDPPSLLLPEVKEPGLAQGSSGDDVLAFEQRLRSLQFDPGKVDGKFDSATRGAVEALEKLMGLERRGRIGIAERLVLMAFKYPAPLAGPDREAKRVEIDLDRQVLILYNNHLVVLITTTSTGNGRYFCGGNDGCQYAVTPPGKFAFTFGSVGWHKVKLGMIYNPMYFNEAIAVHGSESVPTTPASHGCARIPMHIAEYFQTLVTRGDPVYVIGKQAAPTSGGQSPSGSTTTTIPTSTTLTPITAPTTTSSTTVAPTTSSSTPGTTFPPTTVAEPTTIP